MYTFTLRHKVSANCVSTKVQLKVVRDLWDKITIINIPVDIHLNSNLSAGSPRN